MKRAEIIEQLNLKRQALTTNVSDALQFKSLYTLADIIAPDDNESWDTFNSLLNDIPDTLPLTENQFRHLTKNINAFRQHVRKSYRLQSRNHFFVRCIVLGIGIGLAAHYLIDSGTVTVIGCIMAASLVGFYFDLRNQKAGRAL